MTAITNNQSFYGEALQELIAASLLNGATLAGGHVRVHTNIDKELPIPTFTNSITVKDYTTSFSGAGAPTLGQVKLSPQKFTTHQDIDWTNLNESLRARFQNRGVLGDIEPDDILSDQYMSDYIAKINAWVDASIWNGSANSLVTNVTDSSSSSSVTGFCPGFEASSTVNKLAPQTGTSKLTASAISKAANAVVTVADTSNLAVGDYVSVVNAAGGDFTNLNGNTYKVVNVLTATTFSINVDTSSYTGTYTSSSAEFCFVNRANFIDVMTSIYTQLPEAVEMDPNYKIYIPTHIGKSYRMAQAAAANGSGSYYVGDKPLDYLGKKIVELPYIPKNRIVLSKASDLHFGTALEADFTNIEMGRTTNMGHTIGYRMDMAFDVKHTNDVDITFFRPA